VHRFLCPVKTNSKLYFIQLLPILFCFCRSNIRPGSEPYLISTIYSMLKKNWSPVCRPSPPSLPLATRLNPLNLPPLLHFF
jgi:hypothetical protein